MAAIDSLLRLMVAQGAEGLIIVSDEVPVLEKAGETINLSMPAMPDALVGSFAAELLEEEALDATSDLSRDGRYAADDGAEFDYQLSRRNNQWRMQFRAVIPAPEAGVDETVTAAVEEALKRPPPIGVSSVEVDPEPDARSEETPATAPLAASRDPLLTKLVQPSPELLSTLVGALERRASDIFLSSSEPPHIRIGGRIEPTDGAPTSQQEILGLVRNAFSPEARHILTTQGSVDLGLVLELGAQRCRFRVNLFRHHCGLAAALRPIRRSVPTLEQLNLPGNLRRLCNYPNGLVLFTGAAGSGKSTTLAALLESINQTKAKHIITLEDPIEFQHTPKRSLVHQREIGRHVESFATGLRAALRESPDVILLGEMRDLPTIAAALTAAETGHLVLSTLHTGDAASAVDRIIDVFPGEQQPQVRLQLAAVLRAVITQVLIPTENGTDRVVAIEKLIATHGIACQIREGRNHQIPSLIQAGAASGMVTMERSLATLVRDKKISMAQARRVCRDPESLELAK